MNESEIQELERIIDEQQERIEALEDALDECAEIAGVLEEECPSISSKARARVLEHILQITHILTNRQQAGGSDE